MSITSTNLTSIGYIEEVTPGETPVTPAFQLLPTTGGAPMGETETAVSEVIRSDRMVDDLVLVDENINGDIDLELSYEAYQPMITSLLRTEAIIVAVSESDIDASDLDNSYNTVAGDFLLDGVIPGIYIKVAGFTSAENNGPHRVVTVTSVKIVVAEVLVTEVLGAPITMDSTTVLNGESNVDSYSFLKRVEGLAATTYFYYRGLQINTFDINVEVGSILTATMGLVGLNEEITEVEIVGSTYVDTPDYKIMNAVSSVSKISAGSLVSANYESLTIAMTNNIEGAKAIGTLGAIDLAAFTFETTGDISLYFEDYTIYETYKTAQSFELDLVFQDSDGHMIGIHMPKCKFETLESPIDGKDSFFMASGTYRGLRDADLDKVVSFSFMD